MERLKYISLVADLRQIAVRRALALLDEKEEAEDVAGEVLIRLWERHEGLRDNADVPYSPSTIHHPQPALYDLQGRRMMDKPRKGVYIQDGRKVVVK